MLSRELIEFMFGLPADLIFKDKKLKGLAKYAYKDILPEEVLSKEKQGFSIPTKYKLMWKEEWDDYNPADYYDFDFVEFVVEVVVEVELEEEEMDLQDLFLEEEELIDCC